MDLDEIEAYWHDRPVDGVRAGCLPWLPFPMSEFHLLLQEALKVARGDTFLDVGCGVGTKCLAASSYGLWPVGLELVPTYVAEASQLGVNVIQADARVWNDYGAWDIVYLNHPLVDEDEEALEQRIQGQMVSDQVLMTVNSLAPPTKGWVVVTRLSVCDLVAVKL